MTNDNSPIAVEGVPFIAAAGVLTIACAAFHWRVAALFLLVVTLFIVYFFRNPRRVTPDVENAVVAPADGVIIYAGRAFESHLQQEMQKISIFMSVFNVHVNRFPLAGRVLDRFYNPGKFLDVRDERATFENEQLGLILEGVRGAKVVCVQVAGLIARRIVCYLRPGDGLAMGEIYGLIRFGSRLDIYLPLDAEVRVALGERTVAGETILGILP
jgi:phosphatidylserine decarboxylase